METYQLLFDIAGSFFGWLAFTVLMLRLEKDANEDSWTWASYKKKNWDNWLASIVFIPVLIWVGYSQLDIRTVGFDFQWSGLYYLCSGFAPELVVKIWKKFKEQ